MAGPKKCAEGMVYVPAGAYEKKQYPALCVDEHEFTNEDLVRLSATIFNTVQLRSVDAEGRTVAVLGTGNHAGKLWKKFAKTVPALTSGVAGYVLKPISRDLLLSPRGFDSPQQPLVVVPGKEIEVDGQKIPGAKEICEAQGKRLATPDEWIRIASQNGTKRCSTRTGELDRGFHYNADATRNVCEARGAYVEYGGREVCDMNGNVAEWVHDPSSGDFSYAGGSWRDDMLWILGASGDGSRYDVLVNWIGFRCVVAPQDSK